MVLDKGKIAEFGPPKTLLNNKQGLFYVMAKEAGLINWIYINTVLNIIYWKKVPLFFRKKEERVWIVYGIIIIIYKFIYIYISSLIFC